MPADSRCASTAHRPHSLKPEACSHPVNLSSRLGLDRPELRAWAMYDWANSAFQTTIITAVFPDFFAAVAAADLPPAVATARFAWATTIAVAIVAVLGPILGAIADYRAMKMRMLGAFMAVGVGATASGNTPR